MNGADFENADFSKWRLNKLPDHVNLKFRAFSSKKARGLKTLDIYFL